MRDRFVPFQHTFANLYADRLRMTQLLLKKGHWFFHGRNRDWNAYVEAIRQSRYAVATGGLFDKFNPNFLECACLGTPMIGRSVPFEAPWFDECLFPVDIMKMTTATIKPLLQEALERHAVMRENCLNWRDRLLKMYDPNTLLDMLQAQIDGQPVPPGYLKVDLKKTSAGSKSAPEQASLNGPVVFRHRASGVFTAFQLFSTRQPRKRPFTVFIRIFGSRHLGTESRWVCP